MTGEAAERDTGLACLWMLASYHGVPLDEAALRHRFGREHFTTQTLLLAAAAIGLRARAVRQRPARLGKTALPAIARDRAGRFFTLARLDRDAGDPPDREPRRALI